MHLAAQAGVRYSIENPSAYIDANMHGFLNILEACREHPVEHLVYASTSSVYGANKAMPFNESVGTNHPVSLYAATKKANELMAHTYAHLFKIPLLVCVLQSTVLGAGQIWRYLNLLKKYWQVNLSMFLALVNSQEILRTLMILLKVSLG